MNALSTLIQEHQRIMRLVDALEVYVDRLEAGTETGRESLTLFVDAFVTWVDLVHHEKEESIVLPFAVRHGFDWNQGCAAEVRREHRQERYLIEVLEQASLQSAPWSTEELRHVAATARACIEFQRHHIAKENRVFFRDLLERIPAPVLEELGAQLDRFDASRKHSPVVARQEASIDRLIERYGSRHRPPEGNQIVYAPYEDCRPCMATSV